MSDRKCYACGQPGGTGKRELRPYGPNGSDVCAGCVFGEKGRPPDTAKMAEAQRHLGQRLMTPDTLLLDPSEQVGPRPLKSKGDA